MKAVHRLVGVVVSSTLAALVACGDDASSVAPVYPTQGDGGSSTGSSSGASSGSSSGSSASSSSGSSGTIPCTSVMQDAYCKLPDDANGVRAFGSAVVSSNASGACRTDVYVSAGDYQTQKLRRYTLESVSPCELTRDTSFAEVDVQEEIAADGSGKVLTAAGATVALAAPSHVDCTVTGLDVASYEVEGVAISRDGSVGFVGYVDYQNSQVVGVKLAKVTISAGGCSVAPFATTGGTPLSGIRDVAVDDKGRLHVADDGLGTDGNHRVVIYGADGAFVSAYDTRADGAKFQAAITVTRYAGGVMVDEFFHDVSVSVDGAFRSEREWKLPAGAPGVEFWKLRSDTSGPVFAIGTAAGDNTPEAIWVAVLHDG